MFSKQVNLGPFVIIFSLVTITNIDYLSCNGNSSVHQAAVTVIEEIRQLDAVSIFTVNSDNDEAKLQDDSKAGGKMLGMVLPYIISILLCAGAMSLGSDSIAGEKERGTMATMLVLPVKRSHIVYGKLLALMTLSAMTACVPSNTRKTWPIRSWASPSRTAT